MTFHRNPHFAAEFSAVSSEISSLRGRNQTGVTATAGPSPRLAGKNYFFTAAQWFVGSVLAGMSLLGVTATADEPPAAEPEVVRAATIDGIGPDWRALGEEDFVVVNGDDDTWKFVNGEIHTTGKPIGVMRTKEKFTNFEYVVQWRHMESGGNSGIFAWVTDEGLEGIRPGQLPRSGIEIQMLDHGYHEKYTRSSGKVADWFSSHGDVFPVGMSKMKPFPPTSPNGSRSFPSKELSRGVNQWNHYYVRGINGEIRLWVNGEEVSGGTDCTPSTGYLCLEAEGSPVEFRELRIRVLP